MNNVNHRTRRKRLFDRLTGALTQKILTTAVAEHAEKAIDRLTGAMTQKSLTAEYAEHAKKDYLIV